MIILGIDPGTSRTGFAVVSKTPSKIKPLCYGCWDLTGMEALEKLSVISKNVSKLINEYSPKYLAIEKLFFFKNAKTVMSVSEARGVIMFTAHRKKLDILELTPTEVKQNLIGYGRCGKKEVQRFVQLYLELVEIPKPDDAADALAICIASIVKKEKNC
jgi:crossover junction endodeoxyribonuclease RuvC